MKDPATPQILDVLANILKGQIKMSTQLDRLIADETALKTAVTSAVALLNDLKAKLDAALAGGVTEAQIQAIADSLEADTKAITDAVTADTPANPTAPGPTV